MAYRIGADIGGTFTDLILITDNGATFQIGKVLSTPDAPDEGVIAGVGHVLQESAVSADQISHLVHGTTLFTNALIERKGARTALITTKGFRDVIEIAREHRYDMYDLLMERPRPLAPRHLRFEVSERVLADGHVRTPLDENEVREIVGRLREEQIEAVAVCLMHSYVNDAHEQCIGKILTELLPDVSVTLSSDLVPEIREYERTSTTLANVYVKRIAESYLGRLRERLVQEQGVTGGLLIMQSNGGVCEVETAQQYPIRVVESGPAAGALAAAHYGALLGHRDLLSFDMGGTTAKACVISNGSPLIAPEFEVDRQYQFKKGSGLPVKVPTIEMIEIGTGGGSIARLDSMKRLLVGPDSAGAKPGPVSYGRGGTEPTVTDADLVLGYLDPAFFLGGKMDLDIDSARSAIAERVGTPLGLDAIKSAWGIHQMANERMASAARIHAIERGKDVEKFPMFAFGGAGPVHAYGVARILRSPRVIYPQGAGVMSAIGFLTAPLTFDFVRSFPGALDEMDWSAVRELFAEMESEGRNVLGRTIPEDQVRFQRFADLRYRKQGYEIRVPLPDKTLDASCIAEIQGGFESAYRELYGHIVENAAIDAISWRLVAYGPKPEVALPRLESGADDVESSLKGHRQIYLPEASGFVDVSVYDRYRLRANMRFDGPAIIEERESTVVITGPAGIRINEWGTVIVDLATSH